MIEFSIQNMIAGFFIVTGFLFSIIATIGVLRLPDFYTRIHASGKNETLGLMLVLLGVAIYEGFTLNSTKLLFITIFVLIFNAAGVHVLSRAAYKAGVRPWKKG
ncbi:monovalent cation/H(+) antiporter subunit G [Desulfuribacillus alkaliarsenatis]|uniref:Cation:proton antiporter n=1 Tax=Desulfuribacillus alkaliarsenatis TaxID=766136 RepID=A0A1E5G449_9FIRM|nr:monovalent cation/H(+) antiporter subunit G [Desulfuribacillus alkaliarsenatis]OEF97860.1 cation:proton antiporter [Desulfuribacillus alkaliarsenatis]